MTVRQAITATRHLLHLFQPQLEAKAQLKLRRLTQCLLDIDHELDRLSAKWLHISISRLVEWPDL